MTDQAALERTFGRPGRLAFVASPLGGKVAQLTAGVDVATVALQGAQVLGWTQAGRELLWLSPVARLGTGRAVRGGIPVCWPWFGPHPADASKPAHGFVRTRDWDVVAVEAEASSGAVTIGLSTRTRAEDHALWPHDAEARLTVTLSDRLTLALETRNTGTSPFVLTQALHSYFRVADITAARIEGLDGQTYLDKLDGDARKRQTGAIAIDREVDRIYLGDTGQITLHEGRHSLAIESQGSASAVVWNPWIEKTQRLGDMGAPDAYRQMLCIETTNAGDDVIQLAPGACHRLTVTYRAG